MQCKPLPDKVHAKAASTNRHCRDSTTGAAYENSSGCAMLHDGFDDLNRLCIV